MPDLQINASEIEAMVREAFDATRRIQHGKDFSRTLMADWHSTPIGPVLLAGDDAALYFLGFIENASLIRKAALVQKNLGAWLKLGESASVLSAKRELDEYFAGTRRGFDTPVALTGTAFQKRVWEELRRIPFGGTSTYAELAAAIGRPAAFRAVAQANAQNLVAIMLPCHRVINASGDTGGYDGGIERKRWLLGFEKGILEREAGNTT